MGFENRAEYVAGVLSAHAHAYDGVLSELKRGIADVVPLPVLTLFTWDQLEVLVCGRPEMDVDMLKRHTVFGDGVSMSDQHVVWLFEVLTEYDAELRACFSSMSGAERGSRARRV